MTGNVANGGAGPACRGLTDETGRHAARQRNPVDDIARDLWVLVPKAAQAPSRWPFVLNCENGNRASLTGRTCTPPSAGCLAKHPGRSRLCRHRIPHPVCRESINFGLVLARIIEPTRKLDILVKPVHVIVPTSG